MSKIMKRNMPSTQQRWVQMHPFASLSLPKLLKSYWTLVSLNLGQKLFTAKMEGEPQISLNQPKWVQSMHGIHTTCTFYSVSQGFCVTYSTVPSCPIKTTPICRKTALGFVGYSLQFKIKFLSIKMRFGQSILCLEYVKGNGKIPKRFDMPPWNRS